MKLFRLRSALSHFAAIALSIGALHAADGDQEGTPNPYAQIDALFVNHCLDCHSHDDPDAGLNLESYQTLIKGGQNGSPILEGDSERSPLVRLLIGFTDPNEKKRIMPPGRRDKLSPQEIALVKSWIDRGAQGPPQGWRRPVNLVTPKIQPTVKALDPIHVLAYSPEKTRLAIGRYGQVELVDPISQSSIRRFKGHQGNVNGLAFSPDGNTLYSGAGEAGLSGEIKKWDLKTGKLIQTIEGHNDAIYSLAISHNGAYLATGSYDQSIHLWNTEDGTLIRSFNGHQGAVFDLAFRPDDQILASASADRTIKLWNIETGERTDTLSQPLKEQHTVLFSKDGKRLFAGGVDNRIRIWSISEQAGETTNLILETRFAHEGTILNLTLSRDGNTLASSADDQTVKIWETASLKERFLLPAQPDWSPAIAFVAKDKQLAIGRLDGSISYYDSDSASAKVVSPPKPEIARLIPHGIRRGEVTRLLVEGKHLNGAESIRFESEAIQAAMVPDGIKTEHQIEILVFSKKSLPLGAHSLQVNTQQGDSNKLKLHVDHLPQVSEKSQTQSPLQTLDSLPLNIWGRITSAGQEDKYHFEAKEGQGLVFDTAANSLGSKADLVISLNNQDGRPLASSQSFDNSIDPLLFHQFEEDGIYEISISERFLKSSDDHFYRLSIGAFPFVTDVMPRLAPKNQKVNLQLIGYNLPEENQLTIETSAETTQSVSLDPTKHRFRKAPKIELTDWDMVREAEPNNTPALATQLVIGQNASARIWSTDSSDADVDFFRFTAVKDQALIIETIASKLGSPIDTRIEVLTEAGQPVQRLVFEAIRDTAITFRPITSTAGGVRLDNWEEMSLNDYLFMNGEVVKLFLAPRGPDSSWDFYPASGTRRTYFDTTSTAHANFEPCYIVRPHPAGSELLGNGLPRFPLYYQNDDHAESKKGRDSRVYFKAPESGNYLIRIVDTRRQESHRFVYHLIVREEKPDFNVTFSNRNPTINRGSGRSFTINRQRIDGFDGEIEVDITGLPQGVTVSSPITIEAGHHRATGTFFIDDSVESISAFESLNIEATASASINGQTRIRAIENFGKIKVTDPPKLFVTLNPSAEESKTQTTAAPAITSQSGLDSSIPVITIEAGTTIPAHLSVRRNGHEERITFSISNLPHGIIVDNIGLNGVLMPPNVSDREVFLTAADWVQETERLCHAVANEAGSQTSRPVLLKVVAARAAVSNP
jgi:WD40 repeat protein